MKNNTENIEERLIPFIEGVLNAREEKEIQEAIQADSELAAEVQDLREIVDELRTGFASGVRPTQPELTVEEVVGLAYHDGKLETMIGSSELKTRLFASDQALEEYRLLQDLRQDYLQATIDLSDVPEMPESLKEEFRKLQGSERPKIVPLPSGPGLRSRSVGFLEKINPRPLMAAAAAFALVSLGVHFSSTSGSSGGGTPSTDMVSYAQPTPSTLNASTEIAEGAMGSSRPEPSGVTVFTSSDKKLLREQAQKLLANDIRYTVADNRIIVPEKEMASARKVLWGEDEEQTVAVAEQTKTERLEGPAELASEENSPLLDRAGAGSISTDEPQSEGSVTPMQRLDLRPRASDRRTEVEPEPAFSQPRAVKGQNESIGGAAPAKPIERQYESGVTGRPPAQETADARRERLKRLALGESSPADESERRGAVSQESVTARAAPPVPSVERAPAVANAVTAPAAKRGSVSAHDKSDTQDAKGQVLETAHLGDESAPAPSAVDIDRVEIPVDDSGPDLSAVAVPGASLPRPTTALRSQAASEPSVGSLSDSQRLASIRSAQPAVARKYNIVLSVEQRGNQINVYVRPKGELDKSQLDELRRALRTELGLSAADSIIFQ